MDKLKMMSKDITQENIKKIQALFPQAVTEVLRNGQPTLAVDFDVLKQELSSSLIDDKEQRYQFTWPDKKKSGMLAYAPTTNTLRPCKEESVDFDNTQNLYIEGDNLEVLKLLRETYLGKVKMIYIDPPYNTGNDFIYNDDFAQSAEEYAEISGDYDEAGNRMVKNLDSNGRFHTDWLNMIYPRLKLAKDLLANDGVIFISIDDNEVDNLKKVCNEIFGGGNFVATFPWRKRTAKSDVPFGVSQDYEWTVCYAKGDQFVAKIEGAERKYYETPDYPNKPWRVHDLTKQTTASERPNSFFTIVNPKTGEKYPANPNATWRITSDTFQEYYNAGRIVFPGDYDFLKISKPVLRYWKEDDMSKAGDSFGYIAVSTKYPDYIGMSQDGTKEVSSLLGNKSFNFPKPVSLIKFLLKISTDNNSIVLDFFSGSATTAHAVMQLNAEDGGNRKFIMVQVPEPCDEKSEAYKAGYKNICEIGKERIRRAGKKILAEFSGNRNQDLGNSIQQLSLDTNPYPLTPKSLDIGFRVLKLDSSNMKDLYYKPEDYRQDLLTDLTDNIEHDRTPLDLLFQVMLELGLMLSSKIEEKDIGIRAQELGKENNNSTISNPYSLTTKSYKVYIVNDNDLIACFDKDVTEDVVKQIALKKPLYAAFRDSSLASDSVNANFDQIFATYSPTTIRKVL
jgi:adenine-specific DNA-methyltransferase